MNPFLLEAEKYATSIIRSQLSHVYIYHNLSHTQRVVKFTNKLIEAENISEADAENLLISAWFHDTGYTEGTDNHEEISVKIATEFLNTQNASAEKIMAVSKIIMAMCLH